MQRNLPYREFSLKLHQKIFAQGKPSACQIELTHRCNHRCIYCYIPTASLQGEEEKEEWKVKQWENFLDFIFQEGIIWISFTGGEPLLKEDFLKIYLHAKKRGFLITLLTNGELLQKEIVEIFRRFPPFLIEITFNSVHQENFEKITGMRGSFQKTLASIELLKKYDIPFQLKTKLMTLNIEEVEEIKKFAQDLNVRWKWTYMIAPKLDGSLTPLTFRLPPERIVEFIRKEKGEKDKSFSLLVKKKENPLFRCGIGKWNFTIDPYGEIIPCTLLRSPSFPFRQETFIQNFRQFFLPLGNSSFTKNSPCRECEFFPFCHWCPALAYLEKGDKEEKIEYYCELAREWLQYLGDKREEIEPYL